jgi:hypothetical protein
LSVNEATKSRECVDRQAGDDDGWEDACGFGHPCRQQKPTIVRAFDHEVRPIGVGEMANDRDSLSGEGMMRIAHHHLKSLFLGTMLYVRTT